MSISKILVILALGAVVVGYIFSAKFDPESMKGKRVIVTGSSTGIGEQLAYQYSRLGARVLITSRREAVLQKVVARCKELGAQEAFYIALDMGQLNDTQVLIAEAERRFGGLDYLILNHIFSNPVHLWGPDQLPHLEKVMDINFRAYVALATYATPMLAESRGSIAVVSSVAGQISVPLFPSYCASKFALHGFFGSIRHDFLLQDIDISITEHIIGSINTTNAVKFSSKVLDPAIFYTSPADTAYRIMEGTALRERKVFFPSWVRIFVLMRDYFPEIVDMAVRMSIKEGGVQDLRKTQQ